MIRRLYMATALLVLCLFAAPQYVLAKDLFGPVCQQGSDSAVCSTKLSQDPGTHETADPLNETIGRIANIIAFIAGIAAVIIMIVSALRFITSGSDVTTGSRTDTDIEEARRSIANAAIGLVVIVLARTIIIYILNRI